MTVKNVLAIMLALPGTDLERQNIDIFGQILPINILFFKPIYFIPNVCMYQCVVLLILQIKLGGILFSTKETF